MVKTTITRAEYLQLRGLKMMSDRYFEQINQLIEVARLITGEEDRFGHMGDLMFTEDETVDNQLRKLQIKVLPDPPKPEITQGWEVEPIVLGQGSETERQGYLLVRAAGERREEIPLDCAAAPVVEALLKAVAPSIPAVDLQTEKGQS